MDVDILRPVEHWAQRHGDAVAVRDDEVDMTWSQLLSAATLEATRLRDLGVAPGDRVGVLMLNSAAFCTSVLAALAAGAIVVPVNHRLHAQEVVDQLRDAGAVLLSHDAAHTETAARVAVDLGLTVHHPAADHAPTDPDVGPTRVVRDLDDVAVLLYSSGTTGRPRGVAVTHRSILAMAHDRIVNDGWSRSTRTYVPYPLAFSAGLLASWLATVVAGGLTVVDAAFDPARALRRFAEDRVTVFMAVPAVWQAIVAHPDVESTDVSSLETVSAGGAMVTPELMRRLRERGIRLSQGYGLTESSGVATALRPEDVERRPGSVGRPMMMTEARVVAPDGTDVATGQPGELWLRGPAVMAGYWVDGAPDPGSLRDGWLATGDVVTMDDEGYLYVVDRLKDMIITGGINVVPAEIERALETLPGVVECAVVGVPHARWGEAPYAVVVVDDDEVTAAVLGRGLREQIAGFKVPKVIDVRREALPRSANGKVLRRTLRSEAVLPSTDEPSIDEPSTDEPSIDEPSTDEPGTGEPSTDEQADAIRDLVSRYFAAVNARDWDAFAATLHPDVTIRQGELLEATGIDAVTRLYRAIVAQFAEHEDVPTRVLVDGRRAAVEITFRGRLTDGTPVTFPAFDLIDVEDGVVRTVATSYDTAVVVPLLTGAPVPVR